MLREVDEDLVELSSPQQVEVLDDLSRHSSSAPQVWLLLTHVWRRILKEPTLSCSSRSDSSTIKVQRCCRKFGMFSERCSTLS